MQIVGRLAPSPTGYLHLGNAFSFMIACLLCKKDKGKLILRIEDIDSDRANPEFLKEIINDLAWLGIDYEKELYFQSKRLDIYEKHLTLLNNCTYPCFCTRAELRSLASAPHVGDIGAVYPGICRNLSKEKLEEYKKNGRKSSIRLYCPKDIYEFNDMIYGKQSSSLADCGGDFALRRSDGVFAYQLAVTVDDGLMGVNQVVRGVDLLSSTYRQLALFDLFGFKRPNYAHIPLVCDSDGERLAKRHNSLTLKSLQAEGISSESIIGYLAYKSGLINSLNKISLTTLLAYFDIKNIKPQNIILDTDIVSILKNIS